MSKRYARVVAGLIVAVTATAVGLLPGTPASAHGAALIPGSRTYLCYLDGLKSTGEIVPQNPACRAATATSGVTPLYNWFAVGNRSGATSGQTSGFIPDGKQCSGNSNYFDFSGFDTVSPDWPVTHLTAGATIQIKYNKWAAHPGTFRLYVTKTGWNPNAPLTWSEFESTPFSTATDPTSVGNPGAVDSFYFWNATLPAGLTGRHIIYSVWARSDSTETFYGCSDVVFDGGNGNVTGIGATAPPPPSTTCTAAFTVTNSWPGGFQGQITVTNPGTSTMFGWHISWDVPDGETVASAWNGVLSTAGSLVTVRSADWNSNLPAKGTATVGFVVNFPGTPAAPSSLSCLSP
jgi:predicted carbohydrate-binding protein with CBM5 and CBM33 domain